MCRWTEEGVYTWQKGRGVENRRGKNRGKVMLHKAYMITRIQNPYDLEMELAGQKEHLPDLHLRPD